MSRYSSAATVAAKQPYDLLPDKRFRLHDQQIIGNRVFAPSQRIPEELA